MKKNIKIVRAKYVVDTKGYRHGKAVMCLDTGEVYTSATECSKVNNIAYWNFVKGLEKGKEATDGKLYCYIKDMHYYADAIQDRIYAKAKAEYDAAQSTVARYKKMFE